jgi:hypothetical protein
LILEFVLRKMTDLAAPMNMKRKDFEVVASHGFFIFLDPKRIKLQLQVRYGRQCPPLNIVSLVS